MKDFIKGLSDKASNFLDTKGLANPVEVLNEELGGETRIESKIRRDKGKEPVKEITIEKETKIDTEITLLENKIKNHKDIIIQSEKDLLSIS